MPLCAPCYLKGVLPDAGVQDQPLNNVALVLHITAKLEMICSLGCRRVTIGFCGTAVGSIVGAI